MKCTYAYKTSDGTRHEDSMNAAYRDEVMINEKSRPHQKACTKLHYLAYRNFSEYDIIRVFHRYRYVSTLSLKARIYVKLKMQSSVLYKK